MIVTFENIKMKTAFILTIALLYRWKTITALAERLAQLRSDVECFFSSFLLVTLWADLRLEMVIGCEFNEVAGR